MDSRLFSQDHFINIRKNYIKNDPDLRLRQAALHGDSEEVANLLRNNKLKVNAAQRGINPATNKPFSGKTALHQALENQHIDVAEILIKAGWSPYIKDSMGKTPISFVKNKESKIRLNDLNTWRVLENNLKEVFISQQLDKRINKSPIKVLSLACGLAIECNVLKNIFSDETIHYTGIDIDKDVCATSRNMCSSYSNVNIIEADVTNLDTVKKHINEEKFDIVILRQPNIINMEDVFSTIATKIIPEVISPEGILFVSAYHMEELAKLNEYLPSFDVLKNSNCTLEEGAETDIHMEAVGEKLCPDKYSALWMCDNELQHRIRNSNSYKDSSPNNKRRL